MQQNELTTEAMLAKIDELENKVDRLEWENKGIAEWRGEYIHMKEQRDALSEAGKLAHEALLNIRGMHYTAVIPAEQAITALRNAGVK